MQGHPLNELDDPIPENDDLFLVDEHFGLPRGTTYKIVCLLGEPTLLNEKLDGIQFGDWGLLPKAQHPQWRALMQEVGVGQQYWKDPDLLVPDATIDPL